VKTYVYANSEVIAQHDGDTSADRYFYLHDRLGSVRLVIDDQSAVKNTYTYEPFGEMFTTECTETIENPFKFTGQYFDSEIEEYYLRARQYNPHLARFTSREPVAGQFKEPLTLHKYLYCMSDPVNRIDPSGELSLTEVAFSAGMNSGLYGLTGYAQGARGWGLLMPMVKGAFLGGGASFFAAGLQAKWATQVIKGLQSQAARGMLTAGLRTATGEFLDWAASRLGVPGSSEYEFNLSRSFTNLGVGMLMGYGKAEIMTKYFNDGTFREGFVTGSKSAEEAFETLYRMIRIGQSKTIEYLYD